MPRGEIRPGASEMVIDVFRSGGDAKKSQGAPIGAAMMAETGRFGRPPARYLADNAFQITTGRQTGQEKAAIKIALRPMPSACRMEVEAARSKITMPR